MRVLINRTESSEWTGYTQMFDFVCRASISLSNGDEIAGLRTLLNGSLSQGITQLEMYNAEI